MAYRYIAVCFVIIGVLTNGKIFAEDIQAEDPAVAGVEETVLEVAEEPIMTAAEESALAAAETWLELVDEKEYAGSWEQAAEYFRSMIEQQVWIDSVSPLRESLQDVVSREPTDLQYTTTIPGAPDAEYVIIQFETVFKKKELAIETVTPMKDPDGVWRVSGYYIK